MLSSLFTAGKDAMVAQFIKPKIEPFLAPYTGKIEALFLDSASKTMDVDVRFEGEDKPIRVTVGYQKETHDGKSFLKITSLRSDRKWIELLGTDLLKRGLIPATHELPAAASTLI